VRLGPRNLTRGRTRHDATGLGFGSGADRLQPSLGAAGSSMRLSMTAFLRDRTGGERSHALAVVF